MVPGLARFFHPRLDRGFSFQTFETSANPVAGASVAPGSAVDLVVSSGPAPVVVPSVVGLAQSAAATALNNAGLTVGSITRQASTTVPAGTVISQNPVASASVAPGSAVDLVVSSGPPPVTVPSVVGQTQSAATAVLQSFNLTVGSVTQQVAPGVAPGIVLSQNPAAGTSVAAGMAVDLVVSAARINLISWRGSALIAPPGSLGRARSQE